MFAIIGIVIVFGCVLAGYLMEHGNIRVLLQPAELVIIGGAAVGTVLIANPLHILKKIAAGISGVFVGSKFGKQTYIDALKMMYDLLNKARKDGLMALENDVEEPQKSPVFSKNTAFVKNQHVCAFVCDSLRMAITGVDAFDLDQMLDLDLEVHHQDATQPTVALSTMADSLPGLGIVAAVLGVVITMGALGGPPGGNRPQGWCRPGRHLSRHPSVLWISRPYCREHDQGGRRRTRLPLRHARFDDFLSQRQCTDHGRGSSSPRHPRSCATDIPGVGKSLP